MCCFIVWIRDFIKKLRYLKYKISTKFHRLLFLFYFFSIFGILFFISTIQTCPKIMDFFVVFIGRVRHFTNDVWKILKVVFKIIDMWNKFFFQNYVFYYLFFFYFSHFIFNLVYLYLSKNSRNFYGFFILWIRDIIKKFWKMMELFSKKYRHLKSKIVHKFHRLLFFFIFLAFW